MKKICLLLLFVSFISAMPSYAMKVIVNDQNDRVVYSRSSKYDNSVPDENYYSIKRTGNVKYSDAENKAAKNYRPQQIEYWQLRVLSNDIKRELVGTTWYYNDEPANYSNRENIAQYNDNDNEIDEYGRRSSREAADYYTKDLANNPEELIPSGFDY